MMTRPRRFDGMRGAVGCVAACLALALGPAAFAQTPDSQRSYRPPRSVADVIGALGARQADQSAIEQHRKRLAAEPQAGASSRDLVIFHYLRARSAEALGDTQRQLQEERRAVELSRPGESYSPVSENRGWMLATLAGWEQYVGNFGEALRLQKLAIESPETPFWRLLALAMAMELQGQSGQLAELETSMRLADDTLAALRRMPVWGALELINLRWHELARSYHHFYNGRYREAEAAALRGMRAGEAFIKVADTLRARGMPMGPPGAQHQLHEVFLAHVAFIQVSLNKLDEAEFHARQALSSMLSRNRSLNAGLRFPLASLGEIMLNRGRYKDAESLFRESLRVMQASGVARSSSFSLAAERDLARALAAQGRWGETLTTYGEVQARAGGGPERRYAVIDVPVAHAQLRGGQSAAALAAVKEELDKYQRNGLSELPVAILFRGIYALGLSEAGQAAEAEREFEAVLPRLTGRGAPSVLAADATAFVELQKRWILEGYVEHLRRKAESGDPVARERVIEEALAVSDAVRGRGVQLAIHQASLRAAAATPALAELARKEQDLQNEVRALYAILNSRLAAAQGQAGSIEQQMRARIGAATDEMGQIAQRMRKEFAGYANLVAPALPEAAQLRAALRPEEALLALHLAGDRAYVWLVRREGPVAFHSAEGAEAINADVKLVRRALDPGDAGILDRVPEFDTAAAHRLYEKLVRPLEPSLAGVQSLVVIANGALQQLPLGVLLTAPHGAAPDPEVHFRQYRSAPWLAKRYAVSQSPSLAAFLSLRARPAGKEGRLAFIGFGDPIFGKDQHAAAAGSRGAGPALRSSARTAQLDSAELARLPRLPDTAEEIVSIARTLGAVPERDAFLGARANEREVKRAPLANHKVVAFATHGLVPGDLDGLSQPALALTSSEVAGADSGDGLLTMEEVLQLKLDADWVVLSACNTGAGEGAGAEAISGLGRAFFYAGARALLVSSWPVETVSAKLLTTRMFELQVKESRLARAELLRRSMLDLIERGEALRPDGKPDYAYAHPLFWAPFSVVGEGN
jgi:CHAT domain-containing protein